MKRRKERNEKQAVEQREKVGYQRRKPVVTDPRRSNDFIRVNLGMFLKMTNLEQLDTTLSQEQLEIFEGET